MRTKKIEKMCSRLKEVLKEKSFFNVSGGCGVDLSNGTSNCMDRDGIWFGHCPFCGKEIKRSYNGTHWDWKELNKQGV